MDHTDTGQQPTRPGEEQGMNPKEIGAYVREKEPNICQICIRRDGKEIFSEEWNGYRKTDCTHIMSATKSIVSLLVGIAIDRGMIRKRRFCPFSPIIW